MRELRTHFADDAALTAAADAQRPSGYRVVAAFEPGEEEAAAVAGFRIDDKLAWGRHLYVDDLSTRPERRGRGHARALMDWLVDEARRAGCAQLHLDSGVQPERETAHRLYFNSGLRISSYHFQRGI
jgi:GNAT superfamily N-acetyltransferase